MAGYTRVDTINNIADGNIINAADLDGEFDGIQAAFNSSTGHNHDGTAGEGAPILALGPAQDVTISTTVLGVKTTNTVDLGTTGLKFKDFYLAGAASIGGALTYGGVTLSSAVTGTGNMVLSASPTLTGTITAAAATFSGNVTLGDADTDTITENASYVAGTQLKSAKTATNTLNLAAYDTDGTAYTNLITLTASTTPTLALTSIGVGTINNMSIGATTASTGAFTTLSATGNTTIGAADTDTITQAASYVTGTVLRSAKLATNTLALAAYDVDGAAYTNLITLTAANAPTLTLTSTGVGTINNMSVGATTASTGAFTTLSATGAVTFNTTTNSQSYTTTGAGTITISSGTAGTIDNMSIGATTRSTGAFTTVGIGTASPSVNLEVAGSNNSTWSATSTTISGTTMTIAGAVTGTIAIGDLVFGPGVQPYTRITAGSSLSWTVSVSQTIATAITAVGGATYGKTLIRITDTDTDQDTGQPTGGLQFFTSDTNAPTAGVGAYVAALAESATPDTALVFGTRNNGGGGVDANERMRIDSSGNVGIGTSSPTNTLSVAGNVNVTGNTTLGDAVADTITVNGQFVTGTVLRSAQTATNTLALAAYDVDGAAYTNLITLTASNTPTLALTSTGVGTINNMSVGATTASTGAFTTLSATGVTTVQAGTELLPAITTTGDTNTGIWFPAADTIAFTEGGVESMRIDSAGDLGIGTTSPSRRLHVVGNNAVALLAESGTDNTVAIFNSSNTQANLDITGSGARFRIGASGAGEFFLSTGTTSTYTERMRIDSSGNVGIGTSSPSAKLDVQTSGGKFLVDAFGGSSTQIGTASGSGSVFRMNGDARLDFYVANTERARIDSSGNVLVTNAAGLGYGTGAGGTVTQATSRTTGVTLSKPTGAITMFSAAGSATAATFTVTNTLVAATDTIILNQKSGTNLYDLLVTAVAAGSFNITFQTTGGTATDAPVINFALIKGVTA